MTKVEQLKQELAALAKRVTDESESRRKHLGLIAEAYLLRRRVEKIAPRPWWAFWRYDDRTALKARYLTALEKAEDETIRQFGPVVTITTYENPTRGGTQWMNVTTTWTDSNAGTGAAPAQSGNAGETPQP